MRKLPVRLHQTRGDAVTVGTLAEQDRRIYFEYDAAFLGGGIELSPFKLRTKPGLMARVAEIAMPPTRLFEVGRGRDTRRFFGVRRFDRSAAYRRIHMHTFGTCITLM